MIQENNSSAIFSIFLTQYGGVVAHLRLTVLKVVDEDGGEAAHHPDAHVQKEKWHEAQKFSTKSSFLSHRQSWSSVSAVWRESDHSNGILFLGWFREKLVLRKGLQVLGDKICLHQNLPN